MSKLQKNKLKVSILQVMSFICLLIMYKYVLCSKLSSFGYIYSFSSEKLLWSVGCLGIVIFIGSLHTNLFMYTSYIILTTTIFIPHSIMYSIGGGSPIGVKCFFVFSLAWLFAAKFNIKGLDKKVIFGTKKLNIIYALSILCIIGVLIAVIVYKNRINLKNFFLIDVYKTRTLYTDISNRWVEYIKIGIARVVAPLLLVKSLDCKKWWGVFLGIGTVAYLYLFGALKSVLFGIIATMLFYIFKSYLQIAKAFLAGLIFICLIGTILIFCFHNNLIMNFLVRRLFFAEPLMDYAYYEYFSDFNTFWMHTKIGALFNRELYEVYSHLPTYIGKTVFHTLGMSANVGVLTEGFVSAGYIGVFMESFFISAIFRMFSKREIPARYFGIFFVYLYYLNTSFIFTLFLSHGLLCLILASILFFKKSKNSSMKEEWI